MLGYKNVALFLLLLAKQITQAELNGKCLETSTLQLFMTFNSPMYSISVSTSWTEGDWILTDSSVCSCDIHPGHSSTESAHGTIRTCDMEINSKWPPDTKKKKSHVSSWYLVPDTCDCKGQDQITVSVLIHSFIHFCACLSHSCISILLLVFRFELILKEVV